MGNTPDDPASNGTPPPTSNTTLTPDISRWKMPTDVGGEVMEDRGNAPEDGLIAPTPLLQPSSSDPRMSMPFPPRMASTVSSHELATALPKPRVPSSALLFPTQPDTSDGNTSFMTTRSELDNPSDENNINGDDGSMDLVPLGRESSEPREAPPQASVGGMAEASMTSVSGDTASVFSTPADISFGPQSLPFMFRRRDIDTSTPSKASARGASQLVPHMPSGPAIIMHSEPSDKTNSADLQKENAEGEEKAPQPPPPRLVFQQAPERKLSTWRREQLRRMTERPPTLVGDQVPRPIPTLYGPLSLPYARNPSGVDATIADETAYLSHVFGLRPALGGAFKNMRSTETNRSISIDTQSSGTQSRSTSGSSVYTSSGGKRGTDVSLVTEGSSYLSSGGAYHGRPMVIRDPYQNIGIRKGAIQMKDASAETIPVRISTTQGHTETAHAVNSCNSNDYAGNLFDTPAPLSQDDKSHVFESATLKPKPGVSVIGPAKSCSNIREFTSLSTIPGSPIASARHPSSIFLASGRLRATSVSDVEQHHSQRPTEDYTSSYAPPIRIPDFLPVYYDSASMTYDLNLSPKRPGAREHLSAVPTSAGHTVKTQVAAASSKADVSDNGRTRTNTRKSCSRAGGAAVYSSTPVRIHSGAEAEQREQGAAGAEGAGPMVMTIDSLFEKFSSPQNSHRVDIKATNEKPVTRSVLKYSRQAPAAVSSTPRNVSQPLGEISANLNVKALANCPVTPNKKPGSNNINTLASPNSAPSSRRFTNTSGAKGTPGAGKLLKKPVKAISEPGENALPIPPTPELVADKPSNGRRRRGGRR